MCPMNETFKNLPPSSLALLDKLLSVEPEIRCSASPTLISEMVVQKIFTAYLPIEFVYRGLLSTWKD
ncbi:unnamed protein product [Microthlaspi erraticum]|uniref:Protein kinase domain-containing protein n=1 Tax=Microthlaspi erraticum TaxID=1685480 RepID=A0A6D2IJI9_9BRAS|nr:unnamed protein product [Microthlaspi erraticum]